MLTLRGISLVVALTFGCTVLRAQDMPLPPDVVTNYAQCDAWQSSFKAHVALLSAQRMTCLNGISVADTRDQVPLSCGWGTAPRRCASATEAESCAFKYAGQIYADCRARVRKFLDGSKPASEASEGDWWEQDLRTEIIGAYRDKMPNAADAIDIRGKSIIGKIGILGQILDARINPTPESTLAAGQAFATGIFSNMGASDLAVLLFDAASAGVATAGSSAIGKMEAALAAMDAKHVATRKSQGMSFPALHTPPKPAGNGGGQAASPRGCDGRPHGATYCTVFLGYSPFDGLGLYEGYQCYCRSKSQPCEWEPRYNLTERAC